MQSMQSLLNFRQNLQISDNPHPPFSLEKAVFTPLLGQNFQEIRHFPWRWRDGSSPTHPTEISATASPVS
jgi:hypothetical protein